MPDLKLDGMDELAKTSILCSILHNQAIGRDNISRNHEEWSTLSTIFSVAFEVLLCDPAVAPAFDIG